MLRPSTASNAPKRYFVANFRVFIDSDVTIDLLAQREHYRAAAELFDLVETGQIDAHTTPVVLANVEYIIKKYSSNSKARKALHMLLKQLSVLPMDQEIVQRAADSPFRDFEDAMQYFSAEKGKIDFIVTRNIRDYEKGSISVMTAEDFIVLHRSTEKPEA